MLPINFDIKTVIVSYALILPEYLRRFFVSSRKILPKCSVFETFENFKENSIKKSVRVVKKLFLTN